MEVLAGFTDIAAKEGSFNLSVDEVIRIAIPKTFTDRDLSKLRRDCEIILDRIKRHPAEMRSMMKSLSSGRPDAAWAIIRDLKLTESDFVSEGGGCFLLLLTCVLLAVDIILRSRQEE